ncbi:MAG: hypothetical protein AAFO75_05295 [Pseudomonadota bacterium]
MKQAIGARLAQRLHSVVHQLQVDYLVNAVHVMPRTGIKALKA